MLKKIKSKNTKTNSTLDFVLELNQKYKIKNTKLESKVDNKKLERDKRKLQKKKVLINNIFNDHANSQSETLLKINLGEDLENINHQNILNRDAKLAFNNNNKIITDFFKHRFVENNLNSTIYNKQKYYNCNNFPYTFIKSVNVNYESFNKCYVKSKGKLIDFFDEANKRNIKFNLFDEKNLSFAKVKFSHKLS